MNAAETVKRQCLREPAVSGSAHLSMRAWSSQGRQCAHPRLRGCAGMCYTSRAGLSAGAMFNEEHSIMPRGREKDRKVRKKHRKNVERMKGLVNARRAAAKKGKR